MIFTLHELYTVRCGSEQIVCKKSPITKMARHMIALGADPSEPLTVMRGETSCFKPLTLRDMAYWIAREPDASSVRMVKYIPHPRAKA